MNILVKEGHALALRVLADNENLRAKLEESEKYIAYLLKNSDVALEAALDKATELVMQQESELENYQDTIKSLRTALSQERKEALREVESAHYEREDLLVQVALIQLRLESSDEYIKHLNANCVICTKGRFAQHKLEQQQIGAKAAKRAYQDTLAENEELKKALDKCTEQNQQAFIDEDMFNG